MKEQRFDLYEDHYDLPGLPTVLFGDHSDNLVIYIHGENGSKEDARRFAELACPLGYQVMAVDLSGHGEHQVPIPAKLDDILFDLYLFECFRSHGWENVYYRTDGFGAYLVVKEFSGLSEKGAMFCNPIMPENASEPEIINLWSSPVSVFQKESHSEMPDFLRNLTTRYTFVDQDVSDEDYNTLLECWERQQLKNWKEDRETKMISYEESIQLCAIRYSCGRQTYMPGIVIEYITPKLKEISVNALHIIDDDLTSCRSFSGGMGDDVIDKPKWVKFHDAVRDELTSRGETPADLNRGW